MSFIQYFNLRRKQVERTPMFPENHQSMLIISESKKGTGYPEFDQESLYSISSLETQGVSEVSAPYEYAPWYSQKNELLGRYVMDMNKFESSGPERLTAVHNVFVGELGMWGLERYQEAREDFPQMTVEEIEDEMGIDRSWNYGNRPEWDWLFPPVRTTSIFLPHAFNMETIKKSAKVERNILNELKKSMKVGQGNTRAIGSESDIMGGGDALNVFATAELVPELPITSEVDSRPQLSVRTNGQSDHSKQHANMGAKGKGRGIGRVVGRKLRFFRSLFRHV